MLPSLSYGSHGRLLNLRARLESCRARRRSCRAGGSPPIREDSPPRRAGLRLPCRARSRATDQRSASSGRPSTCFQMFSAVNRQTERAGLTQSTGWVGGRVDWRALRLRADQSPTGSARGAARRARPIGTPLRSRPPAQSSLPFRAARSSPRASIGAAALSLLASLTPHSLGGCGPAAGLSYCFPRLRPRAPIAARGSPYVSRGAARRSVIRSRGAAR